MTHYMQPVSPDEIVDSEERQRLRIRYARGDSIKFISHQDEFRAWERALRRADLPILYKRGFNPQPHIQFASPLGVGFSGQQETVDITLSTPMDLFEVKQQLNAHLPPGLIVQSIAETDLKGPALQTLLIGADYAVSILASSDDLPEVELRASIDSWLASAELWRTRERKGKQYRYNLRPLILELSLVGYHADSSEYELFLRVQQREGATGRPDEVIDVLGLDRYARRMQRTRLYFENLKSDTALFAQYPVVTKQEIADPDAPKSGRGRRSGKKNAPMREPRGSSINQRVSDEFT